MTGESLRRRFTNTNDEEWTSVPTQIFVYSNFSQSKSFMYFSISQSKPESRRPRNSIHIDEPPVFFRFRETGNLCFQSSNRTWPGCSLARTSCSLLQLSLRVEGRAIISMKYSLAVLALAGGVQSWSPTVGLRRQQLSTLRSTSASEPSSALRDEGESTVTPDEAALANISEEPATIGSMLSTRTTSLARRDAVEALSTALTRSIERSGEVTGLLAEELTSVAKLLENEIISEEEKLASLRSLIGKMTDVVKGKAGIIEREKELLTKIEDIKAQTLEAVIKSRLEQAVEAKAELITIETELSETIEACKAQLEVRAHFCAYVER